MGTIDDEEGPADEVAKGWRRRRNRRLRSSATAEVDRLYYSGLGARVEKILGLAQEEAEQLREEARRAADQHRELAEQNAALIIEAAQKDAERIRAEAESDARATRAAAEDRPANP